MPLQSAVANSASNSGVTDSLSTPWLQISGKGELQVALHVQPGAKTTSCAGIHGDALKIRLAAPPVDGKANQALIVWLAQMLGCAQKDIELIRGQTNRRKIIRIDAGMRADDMAATLRALAAA